MFDGLYLQPGCGYEPLLYHPGGVGDDAPNVDFHTCHRADAHNQAHPVTVFYRHVYFAPSGHVDGFNHSQPFCHRLCPRHLFAHGHPDAHPPPGPPDAHAHSHGNVDPATPGATVAGHASGALEPG
jgi:hypothetical protein